MCVKPKSTRLRVLRAQNFCRSVAPLNGFGTLDPDQEYVFFCHHGLRSAYVAEYVASTLGFARVANMIGGIEEWSLRIDPSVPRY